MYEAQRAGETMSTDLYFFEHETWAVVSPARPCPICDGMAFFFSNRFGATQCIGCSDLLAKELKHMGVVA